MRISRDRLLRPSSRAFALVIVLSVVTILAIILVTYLSVTQLDRAASRNYVQGIKAEQIGLGALDRLTGDFQQEIVSGSVNPAPTPLDNSSSKVYIPLPAPKALSMVPARYNIPDEPNVIRGSFNDSGTHNSAFPSAQYPGPTPPFRASSVATEVESANGRAVSPERWNKPQLLLNPAAFPAPSWVYVTKDGIETLTSVPTGATDPQSPNFVIGRFAYVAYDEGGLLDVNVAGFPGGVSPVDIGQKAGSMFADLSVVPGLEGSSTTLSDWRNPLSSSNFATQTYTEGARRGFLTVLGAAGGTDNAFLSRQDLIAFASARGIEAALPYLGTFTREINSPSALSPTAVETASPNASLNPDLAKIYFQNKPLPRFPLSYFGLLESGTDTEKIQEYFGLVKADNWSPSYRAWTYQPLGESVQSDIGTVADAIAKGRRPNLFELVKGSIINGSLGGFLGNSGAIQEAGNSSYTAERNVQHHVARIIANMADQYDADNYPTTVIMGTAANRAVFGIESLPYFSEIYVKLHLPGGFTGTTAANPGTLYVYPELWNPHQGPIPSEGPTRVRVRMNAGAGVNLFYTTFPFAGYQQTRDDTWYGTFRPFPAFASTEGVPTNPQTQPLSAFQVGPRFITNPTHFSSFLTELTPQINGFRAYSITRSAPATWTLRFTAMGWDKVAPMLEYQDSDGSWRPYSTFAGYPEESGNTGFSFNSRPFMGNNNDSGNLQAGTTTTSIGKSDPRTFRFRAGYSMGSGTASPQDTMLGSQVNPTRIQPYSDQSSFTNDPNPGLRLSRDSLADPDGKLRPADAFLSATGSNNPQTSTIQATSPLRVTRTASPGRPVVLNRPFRSVGELGYVFRDAPWKSLDFFSASSGDARLLDLFSLEDAPVVAGRTSLNSQNFVPLKAILSRAINKEINEVTEGIENQAASAADADTVAKDLVAATDRLSSTALGPFASRGGLTTFLAGRPTSTAYPPVKTQREWVPRALGPATQTRSWNLMIDLIAQAGRLAPGGGLEKFVVEGERRYWLHVSIDRFTGAVVDSQLEPVYE